MNVLSLEKQCQVIAALTEGCSIRTTERLTDVNRGTITSLGVRVGEGCYRLHDEMMLGLQVSFIQMDETWGFIGKKQRRVKDTDPQEFGDAYIFVGLDSTSKAVLSYVVGKRDGANTQALLSDLRARVVNRPQITSDGFHPYIEAVDVAFGRDVDYAMLVKQYHGDPGPDAARRYSPGHIIGAEKKIMWGDPDKATISTSHVERFNLTARMGMRRMTRLTNAFSKKLENHRAAVSLAIAHYNLCRIHEAHRVTPAMQLGVADHVWTISELVEAALQEPMAPIAPTPIGYDLKVIPGGWKRVDR